MARCFVLEDFSVRESAVGCSVTLHSWDGRSAEAFADIVQAAFKECRFRRARSPQRQGLLALGEAVTLVGNLPPNGIEKVEEFLNLVTKGLTIEDALDESHALAYHQVNDEDTGKLTKTRLGVLVNQAKYRTLKDPRLRIGNAIADYIRRHPRYARATQIVCVPPHGPGKKSSLPSRVATQVSTALGLDHPRISRVKATSEQKEITDEDRRLGVRKRIANQRGTMHVDTDLSGEPVIVIDDLYGSGGSMQEAARALRDAGAGEVLGLAITKQHLFEGVSLTASN